MAKIFYYWFDRIRTLMLVSISLFTVILCFVQVILRYFTFISLRPFAWGDEVLRLCAIWVIFLGISIGVRQNAHFTVDFVLNKIRSPKVRRVVDLAIDSIVVLVLVIITYLGAIYAITNIAEFPAEHRHVHGLVLRSHTCRMHLRNSRIYLQTGVRQRLCGKSPS